MINCCGLVLLLLLLCVREALSIELESLDFPSYIITGDTALMSCLYRVKQTKQSELDIKWYHGTSPSPFLVFLPFHWETPHLLDTKYSNSLQPLVSSGSLMMFQLSNVSKAQGGMYSCKVSTNSEEILNSRRLNVIDRPEIALSISEEVTHLSVNCSLEADELEETSPEYEVIISSNGRVLTNRKITGLRNRTITTATVAFKEENQTYNIQCSVSLLRSNYSWEVAQTFQHDQVKTYPHFRLFFRSDSDNIIFSASTLFLTMLSSLVFPQFQLSL